jgi:hypothetical protein
MKKFLLTILVLLLSISVYSCGRRDEEVEEEEDEIISLDVSHLVVATYTEEGGIRWEWGEVIDFLKEEHRLAIEHTNITWDRDRHEFEFEVRNEKYEIFALVILERE